MGARNPIVSVVIPIFNGAPFVAKAVESILAQGVSDVEIIVVDDGSTDGTQAVLAELATTAGIVWFQQDHGGPARSRNRGISEASGEFIALLDCDDVWLPGKLEAQLAIMRARPAVGVVHTDYEVVDEQGRVEELARAQTQPGTPCRGVCRRSHGASLDAADEAFGAGSSRRSRSRTVWIRGF